MQSEYDLNTVFIEKFYLTCKTGNIQLGKIIFEYFSLNIDHMITVLIPALHEAKQTNQTEIILWLSSFFKTSEEKLIFDVLMFEDVPDFETRIKSLKFDTNQTLFENLCAAVCLSENLKMINYLIQTDVTWSYGLSCACRYGRIKTIKYLLNTQHFQLNDVAIMACIHNQTEILKIVLDRIVLDKKEIISLDYNFMFNMVCSNGNTQFINLLFDFNKSNLLEGIIQALRTENFDTVAHLIQLSHGEPSNLIQDYDAKDNIYNIFLFNDSLTLELLNRNIKTIPSWFPYDYSSRFVRKSESIFIPHKKCKVDYITTILQDFICNDICKYVIDLYITYEC